MSSFSARVYRIVFALAAVYNVCFGAWTILAPQAFFSIFELDPPRYPALWSCLGMVVGLFGAAYAYAAVRLDQAFPFIAIGLVGKILGPIGWVMTVRSGEWPARTILLLVCNDLIWWLPFGMFLIEGTALSRGLKRSSPMLCAVMHALAAVATLFFLRGGSEAVPSLEQRLEYVSEHPTLWRSGWALWMLSAASLAGFYAWWGKRAARESVAIAALAIAYLGMWGDYLGEGLLIGWLPDDFEMVSRLASLLTAGAANGLYTGAGILLTLTTPALRGWLRGWAWAIWTSGLMLSGATLANRPAGIVVFSAALMVLLIPWLVLMGRKLP